MDESITERRQNAIAQILPIIRNLPQCEWQRFISVVDLFYKAKAAKVVLDGNDIELLEIALRKELL